MEVCIGCSWRIRRGESRSCFGELKSDELRMRRGEGAQHVQSMTLREPNVFTGQVAWYCENEVRSESWKMRPDKEAGARSQRALLGIYISC